MVKREYRENAALRDHHGCGPDSRTELTASIVAEHTSPAVFVVDHGYGPNGKDLQE